MKIIGNKNVVIKQLTEGKLFHYAQFRFFCGVFCGVSFVVVSLCHINR